jgi:hypothetical protein
LSTLDASTSAHDIADGSLIGDQYRIVRRIGAGGMGEVYLAEHLTLGVLRAIKVLRRDLSAIPRYAELLTGEAQKQSQLQHDNIVQIHDFFPWRDRYCLVLDFVDGTTLADIIDEHPTGMPEKRALDVLLDILKGLNYAHEHGVLHCDVKPANVLVDREQRVRVTDFGIARDMAESSQHVGVAGTPEYMSPEQVDDPGNVGHRADVYAAGVVLFEMLTRHLPFEHDRDARGLRFPQLDQPPADLRAYRKDLSPRLARIVATALQRDPTARFQGCQQFRCAIDDYRRMARLRPIIIAASLVAIVGTGTGYWWQQQVKARAVAERIEAERQLAEAERVAALQRIENETKGRAAIRSSIVSSITQLGFMCRETARLKGREEALQTAIKAEMPDIAANLRLQIRDIKANQANYAQRYAEFIEQLKKFEPNWVTETATAQVSSEPEIAQLASVFGEDYAAVAAGRQVRPIARLQAACPP